ncbi:transcriptional regulator [Salmonella enterica subsp. enterica]|uniref:Transcriptional regulator n=1 Tax=Salmonella enterica I TaxID=59201 RepID=A0A3S4I200_SALET|nr:transcriptional regulator [Salmonella enterica subsp. enterica]
MLDELNSILRDAGRVGTQLTGNRARCREPKPFLRILFRNALPKVIHFIPLLILYCTIVRSSGVLESIRQGEVDFGIVIRSRRSGGFTV